MSGMILIGSTHVLPRKLLPHHEFACLFLNIVLDFTIVLIWFTVTKLRGYGMFYDSHHPIDAYFDFISLYQLYYVFIS